MHAFVYQRKFTAVRISHQLYRSFSHAVLILPVNSSRADSKYLCNCKFLLLKVANAFPKVEIWRCKVWWPRELRNWFSSIDPSLIVFVTLYIIIVIFQRSIYEFSATWHFYLSFYLFLFFLVEHAGKIWAPNFETSCIQK